MQDNPFAPPRAAPDPIAGHALVFSAEGTTVVSSLAGWMRGLSTVYFIGLAFVLLGSCATLFSGAAMPWVFVGMLVVGLGLGAMATWLRSAATDFERGVLSDDEFPIGQGFRSLRAYLILSGVISVLTLLNAIVQAVR